MEDVSPYHLVCTANDINLASVSDIVIAPDDDGCTGAGDTVTFSAKFTFDLTAQARYDLGMWFGTRGQVSARTGTCTVFTPPPGDPAVDLDGDKCGDIDAAHDPLILELELTVDCVAGAGNKLALPYCGSWRQKGKGSKYECNEPIMAYPGTPSKCKCDDEFTVDIDVPTSGGGGGKSGGRSEKNPPGSPRPPIATPEPTVTPPTDVPSDVPSSQPSWYWFPPDASFPPFVPHGPF